MYDTITMKPFTRGELVTLRERAEGMASTAGTNPLWVRAYLALADAADHLDAMTERTRLGDQGDIGHWT